MLVHRTHFEQVPLENLKKILAKKIISLQEIEEQTRDDPERNHRGVTQNTRRVGGEN